MEENNQQMHESMKQMAFLEILKYFGIVNGILVEESEKEIRWYAESNHKENCMYSKELNFILLINLWLSVRQDRDWSDVFLKRIAFCDYKNNTLSIRYLATWKSI